MASITFDDALAACLAYARTSRDVRIAWTPSHPEGLTVSAPKYAYRAYDCVAASEDDEFAWLDVLVVDGLNGGMKQPTITMMRDAASRAWSHVRLAEERADGRAFWDLDAAEVSPSPPPGSTGEALIWAYRECVRTDRVKIALAHKLLHHKRPRLFPLVDRRTYPCLVGVATGRDIGYWGVVHEELVRNRDAFASLEQHFEDLVVDSDDVRLTRLRLHDILLWLVATKQWAVATAEGRETPEWQRHLRSVQREDGPAEDA